MLAMASKAFVTMTDPLRLMYLGLGVIIGLGLGVIPGLGGIVGMAILLPFTFSLDAYSAFALLLGMGSVTTTSDTIPAVLFGVPGTTGSAATILDGHPLAKKGQAGRAFGAAYSASLIGGVFGALLLAVSIPILRPVMLSIGSPELLAFAVFGLCMVAALSAGAPLRGLTVAGFGIMIAMIGGDPQSGTQRWALGTLYLYDGLPLVPVTIGLFALPELADMAIQRRSIAGDSKIDSRSGQWEGIKDTFRHWWLVIRVSWLGATLGAVPGIGAAVIDWIAYGHAARTEKGAAETFGTGDIRGVLASEGSNNAKEGGALVPTIAFGVPGSASMAILLGAFLVHGLQPGPDMLSKNLDVTYSIIWSVALANILGAGICFAFSNQFAKVALVRQPIIMPLILTVIMVGAYQGSRNWGDLITVVLFGLLGWFMKRLGWPRPPLILGFVLGAVVERYYFISVSRYDYGWVTNPIVMVLLAIALWGFIRPLMREAKNAGGFTGMLSGYSRSANINLNTLFYGIAFVLIGVMLTQTVLWKYDARLVPQAIGGFSFALLILGFINHTFKAPSKSKTGDDAKSKAVATLKLDISVETQADELQVVIKRALIFLGWIVGFLGGIALIGMLPTILIFVGSYMWIEGRERLKLILSVSFGITIFSYVLFDQMLSLPWPRSLLGNLYPILRDTIPSM
ncbi:MAG: tripartite tricarboxylate transporter permease [Rhodospirillaceae bacterium]|nr:tripartite tricarboxylate transporter permease [Rhodospirillaceae bacterium]MBT4590055.1 tripartite tricarboxylate transporter permease [Rhodospirillaceae bacterium]MBT4938156.1 tripartite tricarboxylate transporter permease [Rhodospirillaceae bacterium]MBT7268542.1 tripartite tricarboxylate transporter permease [Rhodospirillaceae bacterium]